MGVTALSPGYQTFQFQPLVGALSLTEAKATVITPHGPINAEWKLLDVGARCTISILPPNGTTGNLILPAGFIVDGNDTKGTNGIEIVGGEQREFLLRNAA